MKLLLILIILALMITITPAFADTKNLSGNSHGAEISLMFSDGKVSGVITLEDHSIELNDIKVIERNDRLYIIDKQNDLKIFSKQLTSDKYLIILKINSKDIQTKLRFVANSENIHKNINQRNLFEAMEQKMLEGQKEKLNSMTFRELQLLEKQKVVDEALKIHEERLAKIEKEKIKKPHGDKTFESILEEWRKSQIRTGMTLVVPEKIEEDEVNTESVVENHVKIKTFLSIPHHQEWKRVLIWDVLVTDDSGHRYDTTYNEYVGNSLSDVKVSGTIKNPSDTIIQSFNGTTDRSGKYLGTFLIPDQSTTRGEYVISVDAVKTFDDNTDAISSNSGGFSVFPISGSTNQAPNASAGPDQHLASGSLATLSGSGSSDSDSAVIFYTWSQTSGTSVTLSSNSAENPTFTVPDESGTFVFSLSVDDGQKTSSADSITVTSLHSDVGTYAPQSVGVITLDGSGSGDALGHAFTFSWTITSVPALSTVNTGAGDITDPTSESASFTADVTGDYGIQLVVDDGIVPSDTDTVTITVT